MDKLIGDFSVGLFFWQLVLFVGLVLLLKKFAWKPILDSVNEREDGIKNALAFYFGILAGLFAAIIGAIFGVSILIESHPNARLVLQVIASLYLLFVTYKIATGPIVTANEQQKNCPTFFDGFILNLLNPKAYAAFFAIFSHFVLPFANSQLSILVTAIVCFVVAVIVDYVWLAAGAVLANQFADPTRGRVLRVCFAGLILVMVIASFLL